MHPKDSKVHRQAWSPGDAFTAGWLQSSVGVPAAIDGVQPGLLPGFAAHFLEEAHGFNLGSGFLTLGCGTFTHLRISFSGTKKPA